MFSRPREPYVSLIPKKKDMDTMVGHTAPAKDMPMTGPMLYVHDIDLPIDEQDLDQTIIAEIQIKPKRIVKSSENGEKKISYDLECKGIKIKR